MPRQHALLDSCAIYKSLADSFGIHNLTPRQRKVLALNLESSRLKNVALMLNISVKTVETHRAKSNAALGPLQCSEVGSLRDQVRTDQLRRLAAYPCRGSRESLLIAKDAYSHSRIK